ncbi:hypothetical protein PVL29_000628 [Vitis rotundifolia]|uniref:THUMP domain-containing protein n=1 Tax=Vitis rotundifolia TaxID=103349 RepID=A0AA39E406_VITRO|nr:hypothetical protein PVL29_000628 [Vitis rotundifolia]
MSEEEREEEMKPWEQHSAVISIPRFDYNAPSSLLDHSHSGFLVTCTIKREKSATKEAMPILEKYVGSFSSCSSESLESSDANATTKRRKICTEECVNSAENKTASNNCGEDGGELSKDARVSSANTDAIVENGRVLSLVKLTRSGLLLFAFRRNNSVDTVDVVSQIIRSLESGSVKPPLWCHRIFPIQATCRLDEKELHEVVTKLVVQFVNNEQNKFARPIKFAVGYNRRGIEETEMKIPKSTPRDCNSHALLDRKKCFSVVAAAVTGAVSDSVVDLKSPELSVLVELLPLSRVPNGSMVVAVSVLPQNLITTKPRLCIKALLSDTKVGNRKS